MTTEFALAMLHRDGERDCSVPRSIEDYLTLLDWTGRAIRRDKRGHVEQTLPPILKRLNIDATAWQECMQPKGNTFGRALGQLDHMRLHTKALGLSWVRGVRQAERMYKAARVAGARPAKRGYWFF